MCRLVCRVVEREFYFSRLGRYGVSRDRGDIFEETYSFDVSSREDSLPFFLKSVEIDGPAYYGESVGVTVATEPNVDGDYYVTVDLVWGGDEERVWESDYPDVIDGMDIQGSFDLDIPEDESVDEFDLVVTGGEL